MIQSLRRRHRRVMTALALLLPAGLIAGVLARQDIPTGLEPLAAAIDTVEFGPWRTLAASSTLPLRLRAGRSSDGTRAYLEIKPALDPRHPDLLVYHAPGSATGAGIPPQAVLLGGLAGSQPRLLAVPEPGDEARGYLLLYSPASRELLGALRLDGGEGG